MNFIMNMKADVAYPYDPLYPFKTRKVPSQFFQNLMSVFSFCRRELWLKFQKKTQMDCWLLQSQFVLLGLMGKNLNPVPCMSGLGGPQKQVETLYINFCTPKTFKKIFTWPFLIFVSQKFVQIKMICINYSILNMHKTGFKEHKF